MMTEVKLPELGEGVESALVLEVLVKPGDTIRDHDAIIEVESEKATAEVPALMSGVVKEIRVEKGGEVHVGDVLLTVETVEDDGEAKEEAKPEPRPERKPEPTRPKPEPRPAERRAPERVEPQIAEPQIAEPRIAEPRIAVTERAIDRRAASPSVRRFARELGVDLAEVVGTGPAARISEEDVKSYVRRVMEQFAREGTRREEELAGFDFERYGEIERAPMSGVRRATAKVVAKAWRTIPMVTQFDRADVTLLSGLRKKHAKRIEELGGRLTLTVVVLKVFGEALLRHPSLNASVDVERGELILKKSCHVGVAMDTPDGLLVPVVRDVDEKDLADLAVELVELRRKAEARRLDREELSGATSTLTNLGPLGTTYFTPIITHPQTSVLGVGRSLPEIVEGDERLETREILPLAVTYDHRAADGADAARFLRFIAGALESPLGLWLP